MQIHGFQKMTLLDFPSKVACTVFTAGCNLRCPFCHNAFLVTDIDPQAVWEEQEILAYLRRRKGVLDGVCITGGEPLLYPDTLSFLQRIKQEGFAVKLDTNGTFPDRLREVVESGAVDYVAMDMKNDLAHYAETVGIPAFDTAPVEQSIRYLLSAPVEYEFRTTVCAPFHTPSRMSALVKDIAGAKRYFIQAFVDSGHLVGEGTSPLSKDELQALLAAARDVIPHTALRGTM